MNKPNCLKNSLTVTALVLPLFCFHPLAQADIDDGSAFYVGVGASLINIEDSELNFDDSDTSIDIRAGLMLSNSFGLEVGYQDLGNFSEGDADLALDAYSIAAILNLPLKNFDIYGKVGANRINGDLKIAGRSAADEDDTNLFFGGGFELDIGTFNLFTEYTVTQFDNDSVDTDIQRITAGIKLELPQ